MKSPWCMAGMVLWVLTISILGLKAVDSVVRELGESEPDIKRMESAARAGGMHMAEDVEPALMVKLPLPFKQMAMSIHKDMDALAGTAMQRETPRNS